MPVSQLGWPRHESGVLVRVVRMGQVVQLGLSKVRSVGSEGTSDQEVSSAGVVGSSLA